MLGFKVSRDKTEYENNNFETKVGFIIPYDLHKNPYKYELIDEIWYFNKFFYIKQQESVVEDRVYYFRLRIKYGNAITARN